MDSAYDGSARCVKHTDATLGRHKYPLGLLVYHNRVRACTNGNDTQHYATGRIKQQHVASAIVARGENMVILSVDRDQILVWDEGNCAQRGSMHRIKHANRPVNIVVDKDASKSLVHDQCDGEVTNSHSI